MNKIYVAYCCLILLASCNTDSKTNIVIHRDKWSEYILKNESALNADLDRSIAENRIMFLEENKYLSETRVYLSHDTSLTDSNFKDYPHIGQFAAMINEINECLLVSYTFFKDTSQRKIITLYKDYNKPCLVDIDSVLSCIDTTEHFIVVKNVEPSVFDEIEIR